MKRLCAIVVSLAVIGICWFVFESTTSADDKGKGKTPSNGGPLVLNLCRIKLLDTVVLAADRPGTLAFVEPEEGDMVRADQEIARMKDDVAQATFATAKKKAENDVQVRYAKKASEVADPEYDRAALANELKAKTVPESEIRKLKLDAEKYVLAIEQAEHEMAISLLTRDEAEAELGSYRVKAPKFEGIVTRVHKRAGESVRQGDAIIEVASTRRVRVEGYINIKDAWSVKPGAPVKVRLDIPDQDLPQEKEIFEGRIIFVDVVVQPVLQQVRVWAEVGNRNNTLRAGLMAKMAIDTTRQVATPQ